MAGTCVVCGAPGRACSGCQAVHYCGKEHQTADWARHRADCRPFKRDRDPATGKKCLVATRDIAAGTVVLRTRPLVFGPTGKDFVCLGCLRSLTDLAGSPRVCSTCGLPVCSKKCEKESPHQVECAVLKSAGFRASKALLSSVLSCTIKWSRVAFAVKVLRTLVRPAADMKKVLAERSMLEAALLLVDMGNTLNETADMILDTMKVTRFTRQEVLKVAEAWRMHQSTMCCPGGSSLCGLYTGDYNLLLNSCAPSCDVDTDATAADPSWVKVVAKRPIARGEPLTLRRTDLTSGTYVRKRDLRQVFNECDCSRCLDPTELGLYMSSICCKKCRAKGVQSMLVCADTRDEAYFDSPWRCEKCDFAIGSTDYRLIVNVTRTALRVLPQDPIEVRNFIASHLWPKGLLHRTHEFIVGANLKLRNLEDNPADLVEVHRLVLEVVEKLDPWDVDTIEVLRTNLTEAVLEAVNVDLAAGRISPEEAEKTSRRELQKLQIPLKGDVTPSHLERKKDLANSIGFVSMSANAIKGPCLVCGAPGHTCLSCGSPRALYCSAGHRMRDWERHRKECHGPPFEVDMGDATHLKVLNYSVNGAPYVAAAQDLFKGERICSREPIVVGPDFWRDPAPTLCLGCYESVDYATVRQCSTCGWPMCQEECEKKHHHAAECAALKQVGYSLSRENLIKWKELPSVYAFRINMLRCALFLHEQNFSFPEVFTDEMQKAFCSTGDGKKLVGASAWIREDLKLDHFSEYFLLRSGSFMQRRFTPIGEPVLKDVVAFYPETEFFVHSCLPNTVSFKTKGDGEEHESFSTTVNAARDIPAEDPITVPYTSLALGTYSRRLYLENIGGCCCARCLDRTEMGLYVGNVCCEQCKGQGKTSPKMVSVYTTDVLTSNWECEKCKFTLSAFGMKELHKEIFGKLRALKGEGAYQKFIEDNLSPKGVLHPTHEAIIEAKREIVLKYYGNLGVLPLPTRLQISSYCEDLYDFYKKVHPASVLIKQVSMIACYV